MSFFVPSFPKEGQSLSGITQNYLTDLDYTPHTGTTTFTGTTYFTAIGQSKISELKKYGSNDYSGVTINMDGTSGYTIDNITYLDYPDGHTIYTGNTSGFTQESIINNVLTRNEHFLGFVEQPRVYSDIFVERGKQGVMEVNLRLGEIDNMGELSIYGNGYYNVKKQ
jgi:hypothetical protein